MYVHDIKLKNYRNYDYADISFGKEVNVIYGNNAQGKTNILESIYLFTTGKSFRTNKNKEIIQFNNQYANLKMSFENRNGYNTGEIILSSDQKKRIKINDVPINKIGELMGFFNAVMFSPEDLNIIKEGPLQRRKFLDILISQLRPNYFYNLQQYIKILNQRNNLLKTIGIKRKLLDTLSVWDEELIECGSRIIAGRVAFVKKLKDIAAIIHSNITQGAERLHIQYQTNIGIKEDIENVSEIKSAFAKKLDSYRKREIEKGITYIGPHRDDMKLMINDHEVKHYGSQGQQRTVVLSLKMAEMELIKEDIGENPILLLDDIMSELDRNRQNYIMNSIVNNQVMITCTAIDGFEKKDHIAFYRVENGRIF